MIEEAEWRERNIRRSFWIWIKVGNSGETFSIYSGAIEFAKKVNGKKTIIDGDFFFLKIIWIIFISFYNKKNKERNTMTHLQSLNKLISLRNPLKSHSTLFFLLSFQKPKTNFIQITFTIMEGCKWAVPSQAEY